MPPSRESGVPGNAKNAGAAFIQAALQKSFGMTGPVFIACAMVLFAFTTLIGNFFYVENCIAYICGRKPGRKFLAVTRITGGLLIFAGAGLKMDIAWGIADISQCVLAFINIPVCVIIGSVAYRALEDYVALRKKGAEPKYNSQRCGVTHETDFWK